MKKVKLDGRKLGFIGLALGVLGTLFSSAASDKKTKEHLEKLVDEKLNNK